MSAPQNDPTPSHPWRVGNTARCASVSGLGLNTVLWWVGFSTRPDNNDRAARRLAANQLPATLFRALPPLLSGPVPNRPPSTPGGCAASGRRRLSKNSVARPSPPGPPRFGPVFGKPGLRWRHNAVSICVALARDSSTPCVRRRSLAQKIPISTVAVPRETPNRRRKRYPPTPVQDQRRPPRLLPAARRRFRAWWQRVHPWAPRPSRSVADPRSISAANTIGLPPGQLPDHH